MRLLKMGWAQELNGDIEEKEKLEAVKKLKRNKAVGVDNMQADLLIAGKIILAEPLTALFNKIFHSEYPKAWTVGLITPIFKKGNPMDCGLTVGDLKDRRFIITIIGDPPVRNLTRPGA